MIEPDLCNTNTHITPSSTRTDDSSDGEIESISSTCTFALNYKLPARYVFPRNTSGSESNATSHDTSTPASFHSDTLLTAAPTSVSNSFKRTRDDMELENEEDLKEEDDEEEDQEEDQEEEDDEDGDISDLEDDDDGDGDWAVDVAAMDNKGIDDSGDTLHNTGRKHVVWLPVDDAVIFEEREMNIHGYADRAAEQLEGRDTQSVMNRWRRALQNKPKPNARIRSSSRWTASEDAVILKEREMNIHCYADRAAKQLEGRDARSVMNRWHNVLQKPKPNARIRSSSRWTATEDAIILKVREISISSYAIRAAKLLEGRDAQSVSSRWRKLLKKKKRKLNAPIQFSTRWTKAADAVIIKEREMNIHGYADRAAKQLEGRDARSVMNRWHNVLKKIQHPNAPIQSSSRWTDAKDAIILKERRNETNRYAIRAAKELEGRDAQSVSRRWNHVLIQKHAAWTQHATTAPKTKI